MPAPSSTVTGGRIVHTRRMWGDGEQSVDAALVAADAAGGSVERPSAILLTVSWSAICWRVMATRSAWPRLRISAASCDR